MWFDPRSRCSTLPLLPWQSTMAGKCGGSALSFLRSAFYENKYGRGKSPIYILLFQATQVAEALKPEGVTPFQHRSSTFHKAWLRNCNKVAKNKEEVLAHLEPSALLFQGHDPLLLIMNPPVQGRTYIQDSHWTSVHALHRLTATSLLSARPR